MAQPISSTNLSSLLNPKQESSGLKSLSVNDGEDKPLSDSKHPSFLPSKYHMRASELNETYHKQSSYTQTLSLNLTTKEGDQVTLDFRQLYKQTQYHQTQHKNVSMEGGARYFESEAQMEAVAFEQRFGFSVKGHLNEKELQAIENVFEQLDHLANSFFEDDIEKALDKAMNLDISFDELNALSLDIQKSEVHSQSFQKAATYQGIENHDHPNHTEKAKIADLPPYLSRWQSALQLMEGSFEDSSNKVDQLLAKILAQIETQPFESHNTSSTPLAQSIDETKAVKKNTELPQTELILTEMAWLEKTRHFHQQLAEMASVDPKRNPSQ